MSHLFGFWPRLRFTLPDTMKPNLIFLKCNSKDGVYWKDFFKRTFLQSFGIPLYRKTAPKNRNCPNPFRRRLASRDRWAVWCTGGATSLFFLIRAKSSLKSGNPNSPSRYFSFFETHFRYIFQNKLPRSTKFWKWVFSVLFIRKFIGQLQNATLFWCNFTEC